MIEQATVELRHADRDANPPVSIYLVLLSSRRAAQPPPTSDHSQSSHATWRAVSWQALPYRRFHILAVDLLGSLFEPLDKSPKVLT